MELVDLVSDLLFKHNCVIIPGIGGFVANYSQAEFKSDNRSIVPPRKRVAFNQSLIENDGLLVNKLSQQKNISYSEAEKEVLSFTKFVRDKVISNKSFEFKNIGTFYLNKDENLVFVPYEGLNMLCASYGLIPVKIRPVYKLKAEVVVPKETVESELPKAPIFEENTFKSDKTERKSIFKKIMPWISTAAVVIFLGFSYQYLSNTEMPEGFFKRPIAQQPKIEQDAGLLNFDSQPAKQQEKNLTQLPVTESINTSTDSEKATIEIKKNTDVEKTVELPHTSTEINKETENKTENKNNENWLAQWNALQQSKVYHIVVFNTSNQSEAILKLNELLTKGYNAQIVENNETLHVSIENFTSSKNAKEYISLIKRSFTKANIIETNK